MYRINSENQMFVEIFRKSPFYWMNRVHEHSIQKYYTSETKARIQIAQNPIQNCSARMRPRNLSGFKSNGSFTSDIKILKHV